MDPVRLAPRNPATSRPSKRSQPPESAPENAYLKLAEQADTFSSDVVAPLNTPGAAVDAATANADLTQAIASSTPLEAVTPTSLPHEIKDLANGLGVTGSAVGSVAGIAQVVQGLRAGDSKSVVAGAAEVTAAAASLAMAGVIGGAPVLAPASGMLLGMRAMNRLKTKDREARLNGAADLVSAAAVVTRLSSQTPLAASVSLGGLAAVLGGLRGLESVHQAHAQNKRALLVRGVGELITTAGVVGLTAGIGLVPGLGLIMGGALLPQLRRLQPMRRAIDAAVDTADRALYPAARVADRAWKNMYATISPAVRRVERRLRRASRPFQPLLQTLRTAKGYARETFMGVAGQGVEKLSGTRFARGLDRMSGAVGRLMVPDTDEPLRLPPAADRR